MSLRKDYRTCFSSDCGYCISCIGGDVCSYKNPLSIYEDSTGSEFIHPPTNKSPWEKYRSAMKTVEEAREWLDQQKKKNLHMDYYDLKERFIDAGCPLDSSHQAYDMKVAKDVIVGSILKYPGYSKDFVIVENGVPFKGHSIGRLLLEYDKICIKEIEEKKQKLIKKYEGKFTEKGKLYTPDFEVDLFEITDARSYGVRISGQISLSGDDVGLYNADIQNEIDEMGDEEFEKYFEIFEGYWKDMSVFLEEKNFRWNPDGKGVHGELPDKIETRNGTYTLMDSVGSQMCDEPTCCAMGHCMVNLENYNGNKPPPMTSEEYGQIFSVIPIYTKEHKHELCALCILNED